MKIESPKTTVAKPAETIFTMLTEVGNFKKLMPDTVVKFELTDSDTFLFALHGMPEIRLKLKEKHPFERIIYEAADGKIPFTLTLTINKIGAEESEVTYVFRGEFNTMMGMMIKNPIKNFIGVLSKNTVKL